MAESLKTSTNKNGLKAVATKQKSQLPPEGSRAKPISIHNSVLQEVSMEPLGLWSPYFSQPCVS